MAVEPSAGAYHIKATPHKTRLTIRMTSDHTFDVLCLTSQSTGLNIKEKSAIHRSYR